MLPIKAKTLHKTNTFESERFTSENISVQPNTVPTRVNNQSPNIEDQPNDKKDQSFTNGTTSVLEDVKKLIK
jgi:hypothetical protein